MSIKRVTGGPCSTCATAAQQTLTCRGQTAAEGMTDLHPQLGEPFGGVALMPGLVRGGQGVVSAHLVQVVKQQRPVAEPVEEAPAAAPPEHVAGVRIQAVAVHPHLPGRWQPHSATSPLRQGA